MHRNMKNFSELLDTDLNLEVKIGVRNISHNGHPGCRIWINKTLLWHGVLDGATTVQAFVPLLDDISVQIEMHGKQYHSERETAVIIDTFDVDHIDVSKHVQDIIVYDNDQLVDNQSLYLGFNGVWRTDIPGPFYQWWHHVSGQGWLLRPLTTKVRDYVASSSSTNTTVDHTGTGNMF